MTASAGGVLKPVILTASHCRMPANESDHISSMTALFVPVLLLHMVLAKYRKIAQVMPTLTRLQVKPLAPMLNACVRKLPAHVSLSTIKSISLARADALCLCMAVA